MGFAKMGQTEAVFQLLFFNLAVYPTDHPPPEIVWWMNWNYAYSICTEFNSNYNSAELLTHPWVINRDEINLH